jgi:hypothetical protein
VKIKLDENLGAAGADVLTAAGFDVATVVQQRLTSAPDHDIARICTSEAAAWSRSTRISRIRSGILQRTTLGLLLSGCLADSASRFCNEPSV